MPIVRETAVFGIVREAAIPKNEEDRKSDHINSDSANDINKIGHRSKEADITIISKPWAHPWLLRAINQNRNEILHGLDGGFYRIKLYQINP